MFLRNKQTAQLRGVCTRTGRCERIYAVFSAKLSELFSVSILGPVYHTGSGCALDGLLKPRLEQRIPNVSHYLLFRSARARISATFCIEYLCAEGAINRSSLRSTHDFACFDLAISHGDFATRNTDMTPLNRATAQWTWVIKTEITAAT